ncbi:MAG: CFI-box-CTERM domain-containing protein [Cyclobacteriaceae bacterium]
MKIIKQNPFRVLGLLGNSTERELQKQIGIIKRYAEIGKSKSFDFDLQIIGNLSRTSEDIQLAASSIEQAPKKLHYSLFWFIKNSSLDEVALNHLNQNIDKAIEIWNKTLKDEVTPKNFSAYLNLSTLYLAISTIGEELSKNELQQAINLKGLLINSESLKELSKEVTGNGISISSDDVNKLFVDEILNSLKPYLDKSNGISTNELISLFESYPSSIQKYLSSKFTEVPVSNIENSIDKTISKRKSNPRDAEEYGEELYKSTKSDITLLKKLLGSQNVQYQMLANKLANEILQCSIDFFNTLREEGNEFDPGDDALKVAKYAKAIGATGQTKNRIDENTEIIKDWVDSKEDRNLNDKIGKPAEYVIKKIELAAKTLERKGKYPKGYNDPYSDLPLNEQPHNKPVNPTEELFRTTSYLSDSLLKKNEFNINLFRLARDIVKNCKPKLVEIKETVGEHHNVYRNLSNELASVSLACLIEYVNNEGNPQLGIPPRISEHVTNAMSAIGVLWMTPDFRQRYESQKQSLNNLKRNIQRANSRSSSSGGCYIATMAYGRYDHPQVMILREFRDDVLSKTLIGRIFIQFYYATSPHLVRVLENQKTINRYIRNILNRIIKHIQ